MADTKVQPNHNHSNKMNSDRQPTISPVKDHQNKKNENDDMNNNNKQQQQGQGQHGPNSKKRKLNSNQHQNQQNQSGERNGASGLQSNERMNSHVRLTGAPALDLQPQNTSTQTFTGRCRLFVANLPNNVTEETLRNLFSEFGQISEIFIGKSNQFAFVKMDTRSNAENAKNAIDGKLLEGRALRVRLAAHAAAIKVSNLPPMASNELLQLAFSTFGPVERAIVVADDRGRSLNEGIIEFARKSSAQAAIKKCQNECLLLSATPFPVVVQSLESRDEEEGVAEKNVSHMPEYRKEREIGPRFAEPNTVEHQIARKWKEFIHYQNERKQLFETEMEEMQNKFKVEMEGFRLEETIKQLHEQIRQLEAQNQQYHSERDNRFDQDRRREDQLRQHETMLRQQEEQMVGHRTHGDINVLRIQENDLRQQASALQQILDRQEQSLRQIDPSIGQHMEPNMYGQQVMHGQQMIPKTPVAPPNQWPGSQHQTPPQPHQHPYGPVPTHQPQQHQQQMPHHHAVYGHPHQMMHPHHQPPPAPMTRPPIVPYNGVPPPANPNYVQQQAPQPQTPQQPQQADMMGNGGANNRGDMNFGKRGRRF